MPALKPEVNVPVKIALKYQGGKDVTSQIDGKSQVMFTLTSGEQLYVSPAVADKIDALGVVPGEFFGLVKREVRNGVKRSTEFEVYRLDAQRPSEPAQPRPGMPAPRPARPPQPAPRQPQAGAAIAEQIPPCNWEDIPDHMLEENDPLARELAASIVQAHEQRKPTSNVTPMPARSETTIRSAQPIVTNAFSLVAQVLGNALISAFDAGQMFEAYAASRGSSMRMEAEQIKCMAISIYIDLQKNGGLRQPATAPATRATAPAAAVNGSAYHQ